MIGGIIIVGSFAVTAALVAREKGRSLWYGLAGWIAPLLPIILLLPYTKKRRDELVGLGQSTPESREERGVVERSRHPSASHANEGNDEVEQR